MAYLQNDDYLPAIGEFNACLNNGFQHPAVWMGRAIARYRTGNYQAALSDLNMVTKSAPENPEAYEYLGYLFFDQEQYDKAYDYFDYCINLKPGNGKIYRYRGLSAARSGKQEKACPDLEAALKLGVTEASADIREFCK
jgi:tetratricopeptide (TPR) repeat protein